MRLSSSTDEQPTSEECSHSSDVGFSTLTGGHPRSISSINKKAVFEQLGRSKTACVLRIENHYDERKAYLQSPVPNLDKTIVKRERLLSTKMMMKAWLRYIISVGVNKLPRSENAAKKQKHHLTRPRNIGDQRNTGNSEAI